jgi:hypothetical protein
MQTLTVIYRIENEGLYAQAFPCHADDTEHAEEQCLDAYPECEILWVSRGHNLDSAFQQYYNAE